MKTLLAISDDLQALHDLISEATDATGGELSPDVEAALDSWFAELEGARDAKLDSYVSLIREMQLRAAARREEAERLQMRVAADEAGVRRLKERLKLFLESQGARRVETSRFRVTVCQNGGLQPLEVAVPPEMLATEYQRVRVEVDGERLRKDLEAGKVVEGARLLPRGSHLRIT